jgi:pilus assembly protein TadC
MRKITRLLESDITRIVNRVINEDMSENTLHSDIMGLIHNSNSSHEETLSILRSIADEMESSRRLRRGVENRFGGNE